MINCIANGLHDLGLRKGDRICLFTTNRPEYIITFIAAASIGLVISPMNPGYKEREVSYQLENSEASAILIQRVLAPVLQLALSQKEFPHLKHILVTGATAPESLPEAIPFATLMRQSSPRHPKHVEISSVESPLMEHPAVMDSAVIGVPDDEAGEVIKGIVVIRKGHEVTADEIVALANGKLAGYKKIHSIEFIDAIPKTASGKILRRELKERERARLAAQQL